MGCGACVHRPPQSGPSKNVEDDPEEATATGTWATKTNVAFENDPPFESDPLMKGQRHHAAPPSGSTTLPTRLGEALLVDADDDFDEIEIIQEATPKHNLASERHRLAAANGQEAPQVEFLATGGQPSTFTAKPLSKQQMEEAAKLAERRKRFDNQRYQRDQRDPQRSTDINPFDAPSYSSSQTPQQLVSSTPTPFPDMTLGLSLTQVGSQDLGGAGYLPGGVPGGILDEGDDIEALSPQIGKQTQNCHDDVESAGFDADDERLMMEILDNCE